MSPSRSNYIADKPTKRPTCCRCGRRGPMPAVMFAAPSGWKRIGDSLGRAVFFCPRCRS